MVDIERADRPDVFGRMLAEWPRWPDVFTDWPRWPEVWRGRFEPTMKVEEFTEGDELVVRAEMPGIDPDKDVEVRLADHMLRIHAERREEHKTEEKGRYRSEFQYGSFSRTVPLPEGATSDDVKATYEDGILEVRVPIDRKTAAATTVPVTRR